MKFLNVFFCMMFKKNCFLFVCMWQQIMSLGDQNLDGHMSFEEFVKYVTDHQKKLWIVFKSIDQDDSGIKSYFILVLLLKGAVSWEISRFLAKIH